MAALSQLSYSPEVSRILAPDCARGSLRRNELRHVEIVVGIVAAVGRRAPAAGRRTGCPDRPGQGARSCRRGRGARRAAAARRCCAARRTARAGCARARCRRAAPRARRRATRRRSRARPRAPWRAPAGPARWRRRAASRRSSPPEATVRSACSRPSASSLPACSRASATMRSASAWAAASSCSAARASLAERLLELLALARRVAARSARATPARSRSASLRALCALELCIALGGRAQLLGLGLGLGAHALGLGVDRADSRDGLVARGLGLRARLAQQLLGLLLGRAHAIGGGAVGLGDTFARARLGLLAQLVGGAFGGLDDARDARRRGLERVALPDRRARRTLAIEAPCRHGRPRRGVGVDRARSDAAMAENVGYSSLRTRSACAMIATMAQRSSAHVRSSIAAVPRRAEPRRDGSAGGVRGRSGCWSSREADARRGYEIRTLSADGAPLRTSSGLTLVPDGRLRDAPATIDTLIVPGGPRRARGSGRRGAARLDRRDGGAVAGARPRSAPARSCWPRRACSTGGARPPTGRRRRRSRACIPSVRRRPRADLRARRERVDLGRRDRGHGPRAGARRGGPRPRGGAGDRAPSRAVPAPSGQPVAVQRDARRAAAASASRCARCSGSVVENVADEHSVEAMAARAHMSPRHFARAFRAETGVTPARYVERVRLEAARRRLEDTRRADRGGRGGLRLRHRRDDAPRVPARARGRARRSTAVAFNPATLARRAASPAPAASNDSKETST